MGFRLALVLGDLGQRLVEHAQLGVGSLIEVSVPVGFESNIKPSLTLALWEMASTSLPAFRSPLEVLPEILGLPWETSGGERQLRDLGVVAEDDVAVQVVAIRACEVNS